MKFFSGVSSKSTGCTGSLQCVRVALPVVDGCDLRKATQHQCLQGVGAGVVAQIHVIQLCEPVKFHLNKLIIVQVLEYSKAGCFEDSNTTDVN